MRKNTVWFIIWIGLIWAADVYVSEASVSLSDAAFAPDWNMIGLATSDSFRIYDPNTKQQFYTFPLEKGAQFIKWSPDHSLVLLTSGENEQGAFYLVLDWQKRKILCSFQEKIRWYYNHTLWALDPYEIHYSLEERILPIATQIGHPSSVAFSPDSKEIAYISTDGSIMVRAIETGEIKNIFPFPDYHLSSIGYTIDGSRFWAGNIYTNREDQDNKANYLMFIDRESGQILAFKNVGKDRLIYLVRDDLKYALALSKGFGHSIMGDPTILNFMIDLQPAIGKEVIEINRCGTDNYNPRFRSIFESDIRLFSTAQTEYNLYRPFLVYDYLQLTRRDFPSVTSEEKFLSSHPISPDGRSVIFINSWRMFLMDTTSQIVETLDIESAQVLDFSQHETQVYIQEETK